MTVDDYKLSGEYVDEQNNSLTITRLQQKRDGDTLIQFDIFDSGENMIYRIIVPFQKYMRIVKDMGLEEA